MKLSIEMKDGRRLSYDSEGDLLVVDVPRVEVSGRVEVKTPNVEFTGYQPAKGVPMGPPPSTRQAVTAEEYLTLLTHAEVLRLRIANGFDPDYRASEQTAKDFIRNRATLHNIKV